VCLIYAARHDFLTALNYADTGVFSFGDFLT